MTLPQRVSVFAPATVANVASGFDVLGFAAPLVVVRRKPDGKLGSLLFRHHPRYYFAFQEHK